MWIVMLVLIIIFAICSVRVVPQNYVGLVETFGKYSHQLDAGLHFVIPFAQRVRKVSLALQPLSIPRYSIISKDNADMQVSVTLNYKVASAQDYFYGNTDSVESLVQLVRGHLRDIIGRMTLDEALGSTAKINSELFSAIDKLTSTYGIIVERVNIDELDPSKEIQDAMDQQLTADRNKRAAISKAEGEAKSIQLTNQAQNEALVNTAKAQKEAKMLAADAEAYRIQKINETLAQSGDGYFRNQSIDAFETLAKGDNNMVVLSKDDIDKLGSLPVAGKLLGIKDQHPAQPQHEKDDAK